MKSGLHFLLAAKRCEIAELRQLALTAALVDASARLIHELQRERGLSNLYLGSSGQRFGAERLAQIDQSSAADAALRAHFDHLDTEASRLRHGARLFGRIAYVLHGLSALPGLRRQVDPHWQRGMSFLRIGMAALQMAVADNRVSSVVDIQRHPRCR